MRGLQYVDAMAELVLKIKTMLMCISLEKLLKLRSTLQSSKGSGTRVLKVAVDDEFKNIFGSVRNPDGKVPKFIVMKVYSESDAMDLYYEKETILADKGDVHGFKSQHMISILNPG
ncbi:unnamed protein product [Ambrosiozyma monospora]|uniref:Unnamed protein product n=1 Tax=Ambrosiozyma monospora TaxID=43982 RepID=A0ACB5TA12_AMBMO|nr:unnamed protein product [Ambrosiozyma monospora]